ncbi:MAG TPA: hypothetical protein VK864_18160 [Longimicrobiales bacterium]|nr:hypothetical protein [Longimicrobiales bacterium]
MSHLKFAVMLLTAVALACAPAGTGPARPEAPAVADSGHAAHAPAMPADTQHAGMQQHDMLMVSTSGGWMLIGMAQAFPSVTVAVPGEDGTPLDRRGLYVTQPAVMMNLESPGSRLVVRTTLNFEGLTQPGGELTFGGWGEGFLDKRHPHTLLHEFMFSGNLFARRGGGVSLSAGKGFASYGTDDPMSRPVLKYPTNHHLSQILERWTINGTWASPLWSVEASVFGGQEPTGPYDFKNIESFADSWSARITRRFGKEVVGTWPWELSASFGDVRETHHGVAERTRLFNAAVRHEMEHTFGMLYALAEASRSDPEQGDGFYSMLVESRIERGRHQPYARIELATRPEFERDAAPNTSGFFRYDHDAEPIGATRWLIASVGYGYRATMSRLSVRPFMEAQFNRADPERGSISPEVLFGRSTFWTVSAGVRLFFGGEPMRMGTYGIIDPVTAMHRMMMSMQPSADGEHRH